MKSLIIAVLATLLSANAYSQPKESLKLTEMKKVAFLQGNWKGEGWVLMRDGKKSYFTQTENIAFELDGLILRIEGIGTSKESGKKIHHAFAVVHYNDKLKHFKMHSYKYGGFLNADAKVDAGGNFIWGFKIKEGELRYTIRLDEKGRWHEIGEFSKDGVSWHQNFEMILEKIG
ncbi:hypothetical protein [Aliikangiella sp. IMCC44359]|uniref:hypothetical protein n=1 Tax=Aliikangiella sp. IMCC44359 TaxID=3459125 RepID=UPI00403B069C